MDVNDLKIGDIVSIQAYKDDGQVHRTWTSALLLDKKDNYLVLVTDHCLVVEANGRKWVTKEPAICFYYTDRWYNVISMVRKTGIYYYCNIASPSLYDGEAIKNIDYDLDVKIFPDGEYSVLDKNEYNYHIKKYNYSPKLQAKIESQLNLLIDEIKNKKEPFNFDSINDYLLKYLDIYYNTNMILK